MTYDENEEYNGPDTKRRGPFLFMAAMVGVILIAGGVAAASEVRADPNAQTQLPSNGVLSIERTGDIWSVATDGIPSEVKVMSPRNEVLCGVNYGRPCATVTTFTSAGECVYLQVDGIPGHNSSDPYICLGGTPSTQEPSPSPTPSETSTPTLTPVPTGSPSSEPPATVESSPPKSGGTEPVTTGSMKLTPSQFSASDAPAPARLADTGFDTRPMLLIVALFTGITFAGMVFLNRDRAKQTAGGK